MERGGEAGTGDAGRPSATARIRMTVPLILAAGWGALFSFMATVLMDDGPAGPEPSAALAGIGAQAASFEVPAADQARPRWPEPLSVAASVPDRTTEGAGPSPDVAGPAPSLSPPVERANYIGTWGPTAHACGTPSRRRGYIPAVLTQDGARAGRTLCRFRHGRREGQGWAVAAECSERGRRWTSQVRLVVDGDRLTWTSGKGAASYVRCGRRDG